MLPRLALLFVGLVLWPKTAAAATFDYYLLSLSWSPAYCLLHEGDRDQCTKGYGFVLHGLWPQYEQGGFPQACSSTEAMSDAARRLGAMTYPSPYLAVHEWNEHGRCTGLSALDYFRAADKAFTTVTIPQKFEAQEKPLRLSPGEILDAFTSVNPKWPKASMVAVCKGPRLSEIRVCLDKDLNPRRCGAGISSRCRGGGVWIEPIR
jgi:ribonuclease T2